MNHVVNFDLHHRFPSVQRLTYHLPGQQMMVFRDEDSLHDLVQGACSYADLRTINGVLYETFKEACAAQGLLADDAEWDHALLEYIHWDTTWELRHLFISIILFAEVTNLKYWKDLPDDFQT